MEEVGRLVNTRSIFKDVIAPKKIKAVHVLKAINVGLQLRTVGTITTHVMMEKHKLISLRKCYVSFQKMLL